MALDRDLMLSIFALDSYNRGYAAGTDIIGEGLGTATKFDDQPNSGIGFYAIAYDYDGEKIISYRGTEPTLTPAAVT